MLEGSTFSLLVALWLTQVLTGFLVDVQRRSAFQGSPRHHVRLHRNSGVPLAAAHGGLQLDILVI